LHVGDDAGRMAELLVVEKAIPAEYAEDALHVAMAARNGMDFVVTWNFTHINNARATAPCWSLAPLTQ